MHRNKVSKNVGFCFFLTSFGNRDSGIIDGGDKAFDPPELPKAPLLDIDEMDMLDVIEVR